MLTLVHVHVQGRGRGGGGVVFGKPTSHLNYHAALVFTSRVLLPHFPVMVQLEAWFGSTCYHANRTCTCAMDSPSMYMYVYMYLCDIWCIHQLHIYIYTQRVPLIFQEVNRLILAYVTLPAFHMLLVGGSYMYVSFYYETKCPPPPHILWLKCIHVNVPIM